MRPQAGRSENHQLCFEKRGALTDENHAATGTILVKRSARSRLYDTTTAQYLTADDLQQWKETGVAFVVIDTETGDDITRVLLA